MNRAVFALLTFSLLAFLPAPPKVKIYMIGDSTMANKKTYDAPETGWGQVFGELFTDQVEIHNHAVNGRSTKSFRDQGLWKEVYDALQPNDYVFIQFGHNDQKESDTSRYAAPQTAYRENLLRYIKETKEKGAIPVILTPVNRRKYDAEGHFMDQHGAYPAVAREVAALTHTPLLDMHQKSEVLLTKMGPERSKDLYMNVLPGVYPKFPNGLEDNTHFTPYGARTMSKLAAESIVELVHPLRHFLKPSAFAGKYQFELPTIHTPTFKNDTFDIRKYGAVSGGKQLATDAINQAIKMASSTGGGVVLVPKGTWLSGPLTLMSNVNLHFEDGALLQFSDDRKDYPVILTTWEGLEAYRCQAPIYGKDLVNVALTGNGILDGAGQVWKQVKKSKLTDSQWKTLIASGGVVNEKGDAWYPSEASKYGNEHSEWTNKIVPGKTKADYEAIRDFLRPNFVSLTNCRNVLLEGPTFLNSPAWTLHPLMCQNVVIRNVNVKNPWFGQNNDALDIESCDTGLLENCTFDTGDDAITIKSGKNEQGRARGIPTQNFIIQNTTVFHGHGGFVIGSEMSGGVKNLFVNNCNFLGTDIGLRFKTTRGRGGVVEDIYIANINMNNILGDAIRFNMFYEAVDPVAAPGENRGLPDMEEKPLDEGTPSFKNFYIQNIACMGAETAVSMRGVPEMNVKNIHLTDAYFKTTNGMRIIEADGLWFKNVTMDIQAGTAIQLSNAKNMNIDNLSVSGQKPLFMELNGNDTKGIEVRNSDLSNFAEQAVFMNKAPKNSLKIKK